MPHIEVIKGRKCITDDGDACPLLTFDGEFYSCSNPELFPDPTLLDPFEMESIKEEGDKPTECLEAYPDRT